MRTYFRWHSSLEPTYWYELEAEGNEWCCCIKVYSSRGIPSSIHIQERSRDLQLSTTWRGSSVISPIYQTYYNYCSTFAKAPHHLPCYYTTMLGSCACISYHLTSWLFRLVIARMCVRSYELSTGDAQGLFAIGPIRSTLCRPWSPTGDHASWALDGANWG